MGRFRKIIEDTLNKADNPFVIRLISSCGTTNNLLEGGLILPDGQIIKVFTESTISYYDLVSKVYSAVSSLNDNSELLEQFDLDIEDNNIIKYSIGHDFQPNFIALPSIMITDQQKAILQYIINALPEDQDISVMSDEDLLKDVTATKGMSIETVLDQLISEQLDEGEQKVFDKDSGYNSSDDEEYYWDLIKEKWPDAEKSITLDDFRNPENHRPWQCDYYVPSEKMIIQINKNWKHGRRPYNPEDPSCQEDVEWLKSEKGEYYDKVLYTWTELEPLKRLIAKVQGYKYVEIFNMDEFDAWYKDPSLTYEEYKHPTTLKYDRDEYFAQKANGRDIYGNDSNPHYSN